MPYADPVRQRAYQLERYHRLRTEFFAGRVCLRCGASEDLEVHHFVSSEKLHHRVWSWSAKRREAELAKCIVLCDSCHTAYHAASRRRPCGSVARYDRGCRCDPCRAAKAADRLARKLAGATA